MSRPQQPEAVSSAPDYRLHCRTCLAAFWGMLELLKHQERCGEPAKQAKTPRQKRKKGRGRSA